MKVPKIDLKELKKLKQENFEERLRFIDMYADWIKKTSNRKWSGQQKDLVTVTRH